jgi:hypothetical protein
VGARVIKQMILAHEQKKVEICISFFIGHDVFFFETTCEDFPGSVDDFREKIRENLLEKTVKKIKQFFIFLLVSQLLLIFFYFL